uniref:Phosphoserine aminotransferase n=1 Tax=Panagrolaimus sp. JU765 TaxID=591449 RepID=A0AC34RPM3_9BILA
MNVPFRIGGCNETLEAEFLKEATSRGMISLKGHRSVGGIRASIYNSITLEEVQTLVDFMNEFQQKQA